MQLNQLELRDYQNYITGQIPNLPKGTYYFRDFFHGRTASPRIARKFFEDVSANRFTNVALRGSKSCEGYIIF